MCSHPVVCAVQLAVVASLTINICCCSAGTASEDDGTGDDSEENSSVNRFKYIVLICDDITPSGEAESYMDKEDKENELKQVVGDTLAACASHPRERDLLPQPFSVGMFSL